MSTASIFRAMTTRRFGKIARYIAAASVAALAMLTDPMQPAGASSAKTVHLTDMAGEWRGSGWGLRHATAPQERVRCRMRARYHKRVRRLALSGKCAAASRSFTILGHLAEYPGSDRITGRWVNPDGLGSMNIRGSRKANAIAFTFEAKDRKTKETRTYRTTWQMSRSAMIVRTHLADHDDKPVGLIQFER